MFTLLNKISFTDTLSALVAGRAERNKAIHEVLMSAIYDAYNTDFRIEEVGYKAAMLSEFGASMSSMQGEDIDAIFKWINKFSPTKWDKKAQCFTICKDITSQVLIYAMPDEADKITAFWEHMVKQGLCLDSNRWHNYTDSIAQKAEKAFGLQDAEKILTSLLKKMRANQLAGVADTLENTFKIEVMAIQAKEAAKVAPLTVDSPIVQSAIARIEAEAEAEAAFQAAEESAIVQTAAKGKAKAKAKAKAEESAIVQVVPKGKAKAKAKAKAEESAIVQTAA